VLGDSEFRDRFVKEVQSGDRQIAALQVLEWNCCVHLVIKLTIRKLAPASRAGRKVDPRLSWSHGQNQ
jgi:hypothetical protein